jgi:hypothetical protein
MYQSREGGEQKAHCGDRIEEAENHLAGSEAIREE